MLARIDPRDIASRDEAIYAGSKSPSTDIIANTVVVVADTAAAAAVEHELLLVCFFVANDLLAHTHGLLQLQEI